MMKINLIKHGSFKMSDSYSNVTLVSNVKIFFKQMNNK